MELGAWGAVVAEVEVALGARQDAAASRFRAALARGPEVLSRKALPAHLTASAVLLSPDGASVLLLLHRKLGRWLQPGGHVEPEDLDLAAAGHRELVEETGVVDADRLGALPVDLDAHLIPARAGEPEHWHLDVRYAYRARTWAVPGAPGEGPCRWFGLGELGSIDTDESVRRAVVASVDRARGLS